MVTSVPRLPPSHRTDDVHSRNNDHQEPGRNDDDFVFIGCPELFPQDFQVRRNNELDLPARNLTDFMGNLPDSDQERMIFILLIRYSRNLFETTTEAVKFYPILMLQTLFEKLKAFLGADHAAYTLWTVAFMLWTLAFVLVSERNIDSYSSYLSRGVMLCLFNIPNILWSDGLKVPKESLNYIIKRNLILVFYGFFYA